MPLGDKNRNPKTSIFKTLRPKSERLIEKPAKVVKPPVREELVSPESTELRNSGVSVKELASKLGVGTTRIVRDFKWWCNARGLKPELFMVLVGYGGKTKTYRYNLPVSFVDYAIRTYSREKHIYLVNGDNNEPVIVVDS